MKLNESILREIDKVFDSYYESLSPSYKGEKFDSVGGQLVYHIFFKDEDIDYVERGDFTSDYFKIAITKKSSHMVYQAFLILRSCGEMFRKDIIDSVNLLLLENWHDSHEEVMYMIVMYFRDTSSLPYLEKAAVWDDECIKFFIGGFHKDAIRGILKIAKKDSIEILENLVGKVDEETAPFLERKIKEAKEIYLSS